MEDYDKYKRKVIKTYKKRKFFKKYKFVLIAIGVILVGAVTTLLIMRGMPAETPELPETLSYGETLEYSVPKAMLGGETGHFEFYNTETKAWEVVAADSFAVPGDYQVKFVSNRVFGATSERELPNVVVSPKEVFVQIKTTSVPYGNSLSKDDIDLEKLALLDGDSIQSVEFEYDDTKNKTDVIVKEGTLKIINKNGKDVTKNYSFNYVKQTVTFGTQLLTFNKNALTSSLNKEYDKETYNMNQLLKYGKFDGYNKLISTGLDASTYKVTNVEYHFENANGESVENPKNAGTYHFIIDNLTIKDYETGTVDYSERFSQEELDITFTITKKGYEMPPVGENLLTYSGSEITYVIDTTDKDYTVTGNKATETGTYQAAISFGDEKNNYIWKNESGETTDSKDLTYTYTIQKQKVDKPSKGETELLYDGTEKVYLKDLSSPLYEITNNKQTSAGNYTATINLLDKSNYEWKDGTQEENTDGLKYNFKIVDKVSQIPVADSNTYYYTGSEITYQIEASELYNITNNITQTNAGTYSIVVTLNNENYVWSDGTKTPKTYTFTVNKQKVYKPQVGINELVYNGTELTYEIDTTNKPYAISGNKKTYAGSYQATISLKDKNNYVWVDDNGTVIDSLDLSYGYTIQKQKVQPPQKDNTLFIYDGENKTYTLTENALYTITGNEAKKNAGTYNITVELNDKDNTVWNNGSSDDLIYTFTIAKKVVNKPIVPTPTLIYNGSIQTYAIPLNDAYEVTDNTATSIGNYEALVSLKDKSNYIWNDETSDDLTLEYSIVQGTVVKPTEDPNFNYTYSGVEQTFYLEGNDYYSIYNTSVTPSQDGRYVRIKDAGTYTVIVRLSIPHYTWDDGTTDDLLFTFKINKAPLTIKANDLAITYGDTPSGTISYTGFVGEENESVLTGEIEYNYHYNQFDDIGTFDIDPSGLTSDNYLITYENGSLKVNTKDVTISWDADSLEYTGSEIAPTPSIASGIVNGDVLGIEVTGKRINAGSGYVATAANLTGAKSVNYKLSGTLTKTFEITKVGLTIKANDKTIIYGSDIDNDGVQYTGFKGADNETNLGIAESITYIYTYVRYGDVGTYDINPTSTVTLTNYNITFEKGTLTVNPLTVVILWTNTSVEYTGASQSPIASITNKVNDDDVSLVVSGSGNAAGGAYSATVTEISGDKKHNYVLPGDASVNTNFEISKKKVAAPLVDPTVFAYTGSEQTYNPVLNSGDESLVEITGNKATNAGSVTVYVSIKDKANYEWADDALNADKELTFTILKQKLALPTADPTVFTYTGSEQTYNPVIALDVVSKVTVSGNVKTNAGTYADSVSVSINNTSNYEWMDGDASPKLFTFEIAKKRLNKPTKDETVFTYTGLNQTYTPVIEEAAKTLIDVTNNIKNQAGSYTVTLSLNDTTNYEWSDGTNTNIEFPFTINKATLTVTANDKTITYKDAPTNDGVVYSGFVNGENSSTALTGLIDYDYSYVQYQNVGTYTITPKGKEGEELSAANYNIVFENGTLTVNPFTVTFTYTNLSFEFDGNEHFPTLTSINDIKDGDEVNVATYNLEPQVDCGTYDLLVLTLTGEKAVNYSPTNIPVGFTITIGQIDKPTEVEKTYTYNGLAQTFEMTGLNPELMNIENNIKTNAGTYTVTISLKDPSSYTWDDASTDDLEFTFTINKAPLSITARPKQITYGDDPANDGVTYSGFVNGEKEDTEGVLSGSIEYVYDYTRLDNIGDYTITPKAKAGDELTAVNYNITFHTGTLIVVQKLLTVSWSNTTLTYNGSSQGPTLTITGKADGDTYPLLEAVTNKKTNAGTYTAGVEINGSNKANYLLPTDGTETVTYTIKKVEVAIPTADSTVFTYTSSAQTYTPTGSYDPVIMDIDNNEQTNAGTYNVEVTLKDTDNYKWVTDFDGNFSFVINKKKLTLPEADETVFTYNNTLKTYTPTIPVSEKTYTTVSNNTRTVAGTQKVTVSINDTGNYEWSNGTTSDISFDFTVNKRKLAFPEAIDTVFTYNGAAQTYTPTIIGSEQEFIEVANNTKTAAGEYTVTASIIDTGNFEWTDGSIEIVEFEFVINKRALTKPTADPTVFTYNGLEQTYSPVFVGLEASYITVTNNTRTLAGSQNVCISIADKDNNMWTDTTDDDFELLFVINKKEIVVNWSNLSLIYNGSAQKPTATTTSFVDNDLGPNPKVSLLVSGEQTNVSDENYTATLSIEGSAKDNYSLPEESTVEFSISKRKLQIPTEDTTTYVYDGLLHAYFPVIGMHEDAYIRVTDNERTLAGDQTVTVSIKDKDNYEWSNSTTTDYEFTFTIQRKEVAIIWTNTTLTYNGTEQKPNGSIKESDIVGSDDLSLTLSSGKINAGTYNTEETRLNATLTGLMKDNYVIKSGDEYCNYVINKQKLVAPSECETVFTYNTHEQTYILGGSYDANTMNVTGDKRTNAGSQTVTVTIKDTANYEWENNLFDGEFTFEINRKPIDVTALPKGIFYGDAPSNAGVSYSENNEIIESISEDFEGSLDYDYEYTQGGPVGQYKITPKGISLKSSSNYVIGSFIAGTLTVNKKVLAIEWSHLDDYVYDGTVRTPTAIATNLEVGDVVTIVTSSTAINAGTDYTVTAINLTGEDASNYALPANNTAKFSILKKEIDIYWTNTSLEYNGYKQFPTATATGLIDDDEVELIVGALENDNYNVGDFTATIQAMSGSDISNYKLPKNITESFEITPKELRISYSNSTITYNGQEQWPEYSISSGLVDLDTGKVGLTHENAGINAGDYTITISLIGTRASCYSIKAGDDTKDYSILKKDIAIKFQKEIEYGSAIPTPTESDCIITGVCDSDSTIEFDYSSISLTTPYTQGATVKTYTATLSGITISTAKLIGNYNVTFPENITGITVTKKKVTVTLNETDYLYTGEEVVLDYTVNGVYGLDVVHINSYQPGSLGTNVSNVNYIATPLTLDNANYELNGEIHLSYSISYRLQPKLVTTYYSTYATYNGDSNGINLVITDANYTAEEIEKFLVIEPLYEGKVIEAGNYSVRVTPNPNCKWDDGTTTPMTITFVISKKQITRPTAINPNPRYNWNNTEITYNTENLNSWNSAYMVISENVQTDIGEYQAQVRPIASCEWSTGGPNDTIYFNYSIVEPVRISKGDFTSQSYEYNNTYHQFFAEDNSRYAITNNGGTNADEYDVIITPTNNAYWTGNADEYSQEPYHVTCYITKKLNVPLPVYEGTVGTYDDLDLYDIGEYVKNSNPSGYKPENWEFIQDYVTITPGSFSNNNLGDHYVVVTLKDSSENFEGCSNSKRSIAIKYTIIDSPNIDFTLVQRFTQLYYLGPNEIYPYYLLNNTSLLDGKATYKVLNMDDSDAEVPYALGSYKYRVTLNDGYHWNDRVETYVDFNFEIVKRPIPIFENDNNSLPYTGDNQRYLPTQVGTQIYLAPDNIDLAGYTYASIIVYEPLSNERLDLGSKDFNISLYDTDSMEWEDHSTTPKQYTFSIVEAAIDVPGENLTLKAGITYDGSYHNYYTDFGTINKTTLTIKKDGNIVTQIRDAGHYEVKVEPKTGYVKWANWNVLGLENEHSPVTYEFDIYQKEVEKPAVIDQIYTYDGDEHSFDYRIGGYDAFETVQVRCNQTMSRANAGTIVFTIYPYDSNYVFEGGDESIVCSLTVERQVIEKPIEVNQTVTYDGTQHSFYYEINDDNAYNSEYVTYSRSPNLTNAGVINITITTKNNYKFSDDSTEINCTLTIEKRTLNVKLKDVSVTYDGLAHEFDWDDLVITGDGLAPNQTFTVTQMVDSSGKVLDNVSVLTNKGTIYAYISSFTLEDSSHNNVKNNYVVKTGYTLVDAKPTFDTKYRASLTVKAYVISGIVTPSGTYTYDGNNHSIFEDYTQEDLVGMNPGIQDLLDILSATSGRSYRYEFNETSIQQKNAGVKDNKLTLNIYDEDTDENIKSNFTFTYASVGKITVEKANVEIYIDTNITTFTIENDRVYTIGDGVIGYYNGLAIQLYLSGTVSTASPLTNREISVVDWTLKKSNANVAANYNVYLNYDTDRIQLS